MMLLAVATAIVLARRTCPRFGLTVRQRLGLGFGAFCGAMIGAKLPFVLADWEGLVSGRAWFDNGKTIVFGLVGGYFGVELAKWVLGVRVKTGDGFAVPVAAAVAVGRLGLLLRRVLLRDGHGVALGDRFRRWPAAPSHAALRVRVSPGGRRCAGDASAPPTCSAGSSSSSTSSSISSIVFSPSSSVPSRSSGWV